MKSMIFASRNTKEVLRDPLSYIFCLGFPMIMLIIMSIVNQSIPAQANMTIFNIDNLSSGIAVFGLTFTMLFTALQISKDRCGTFLIRLYASPMKPFDFISGYTFPLLIIAFSQCIITYLASLVISLILDTPLNVLNLIISALLLIPSSLMFIGIGLLFGSIFNDKSAPGLCSIIITLSCMLGGVWMDVENLKGILKTMCNILPFYHSVKIGRMAISGNYQDFGQSMIIVCIYTVVIYILAITAFNFKMRKDQR